MSGNKLELSDAFRKIMALLLATTTTLGPTALPVFAASKPVKAATAAPATATPIQHLVVIFQENVSFDHYFGTYPEALNPAGEPKFKAAASTPTVNGLNNALLNNNPNLNPANGAGASNPFRLDRSQAVTPDQNHDYTAEQQAFDAGLMDLFPAFASSGGNEVLGYFDGNTVTAFWNYAQSFAMSDNSYSTTFGPSTPGALNLIAAQTHGAMLAPDVHGAKGSASGNVTAIDSTGVGGVIGDPRPSPTLDNCTLPSNADPTKARTYITMTGPNVGDLLNERHVTWGWFQGGFQPA